MPPDLREAEAGRLVESSGTALDPAAAATDDEGVPPSLSKLRYSILIIVFILWLIVMPLAFATLYSVIELQSAAKAASKDDSRLSALRTRELAAKLNEADRVSDLQQQLLAKRSASLSALFKARDEVRASAIALLSEHGVTGATQLCTAPAQELQTCQIDMDLRTCTGDWLRITSCYEQAIDQGRPNVADAAAVREIQLAMKDARDKGFDFYENTINANAAIARSAQAKALQADPLFSVAQSYRNIHLPFFASFFALPQGVIVACFTSLMAALGAGVSSLLNFLRVKELDRTEQDLAKSFLISPLLGGLIGFMVYFVVSAGTAFLVQPAPANPAQATSNLSAPALASLGILAGLAAESAVDWLQAKAAAFFKS